MVLRSHAEFVQVMAWCQTGNKSLPQPMVIQVSNADMYNQATMIIRPTYSSEARVIWQPMNEIQSGHTMSYNININLIS